MLVFKGLVMDGWSLVPWIDYIVGDCNQAGWKKNAIGSFHQIGLKQNKTCFKPPPRKLEMRVAVKLIFFKGEVGNKGGSHVQQKGPCHQEFQVPKMEGFLNLTFGYFGGGISLT